MPSGQAHETINLTFFGGLAAGYAYARSQGLTDEIDIMFEPQTLALFSLSYLIGSFLVTPDLDLAEQHVRAKKHWGLLGLLWIPYGVLFNHRGLSHTWILGPATRLIYMTVVGLAITYLITYIMPYFGYQVSFQAQLVRNWQELVVGALAGYYLSQWLHLIADGIKPDHGVKRRAKRGGKRGRGRRKPR